jgi:hypothetical protein
MSSNPAFSGTVKMLHFFTVIYDLDELLFAITPAYRLSPADDNHQW